MPKLSRPQRQLLRDLWTAKAFTFGKAVFVAGQQSAIAALQERDLISVQSLPEGFKVWLTEKGQLTAERSP
jgi:hypothetical protein